jgi:hypothetical protein
VVYAIPIATLTMIAGAVQFWLLGRKFSRAPRVESASVVRQA